MHNPLPHGRAWRTSTWIRSFGNHAKSPCSALLNQWRLLLRVSSIRTLPGSSKAATANWYERRRLIARCWFSSTPGLMRAWHTISNDLGSRTSTRRSSFKTACLVNVKNGWPSIISDRMRGHIGSSVKFSMRSQDQRLSIASLVCMRPNNRFHVTKSVR